MDEKLLGQALQYHGADLLYSLKAELQDQPSAAVLSQMERKHHREPEINFQTFQGLYDIVRNHLGFQKVCAHWVPKTLTDDLKDSVQDWLTSQLAPFYEDGIQKLVPRYKCLNNGGDYVEKDAEFQKSVCAFIGRKSDMLFRPLSEEDKSRRQDREIVDDAYAIMPAVESFFDVPSHLRRGHFYRCLRPDDCVSGVVVAVLENGLRIQLLCVDKGYARDIDDLDIQAFCPVKELPKLFRDESALEVFQEKDIVRGIVLVVVEETEKIVISLHEKSIPNKNTYPRIGLITEEEFPVHYGRKKQIEGMFYEEVLHSILGFNNTGNVKALVEQLGIQEDASYMRYLSRLHIPEKEYAEGLRKWQSEKLAYHSVAQGVEMFKGGKYMEALQYFNRALQIDNENVEALVARGALYANKENFQHAIEDFEKAISINPKHSNARNYMVETLLAFGKTCEDKRNFEEAAAHYSHVLKIDPSRVEAVELIKVCQFLMTDTKNKKDVENDSSILSKTADKLRQLIQEDKKDEMRRKKHRRQSSGSSEKARKRRRSDSSSSSSSEDRRRQKKEPRPSSSVNEKKRRRTEKEGKRQSVDGNEGMKDKDFNPKDKKPEWGPQKVQSAAAAEILPVSSLEYFSRSTTIPGLGSPPPSADAAEDRRTEQSSPDDPHGINVEKPQESVQMLRRDDFLMAEREKFYRDNKDSYKKSPVVSIAKSSSSSRSSRSPSCSASADKKERSEGSQSKPRTERAPVVTGIEELNKYLGGAKELLNRIHSKEKPTTWALFSDLFTAESRFSPHGQRSNSTNRYLSKDSGSKSPELSKSQKVVRAGVSEDASRKHPDIKQQVGLETHQSGQQRDDRYGNTSRRDSAEKEIPEKSKGKGIEQGSIKKESHSAVDKDSISKYNSCNDERAKRHESNNLERLKLAEGAGDNKETVLDTRFGISRLPQERKTSSSFREQETRKIGQTDYRDDERNNVQSSKPLKQATDGAEKNSLRAQSGKYQTGIVGLNLQNESRHLEKQKQSQAAGAFFLQTLQEGKQGTINVSSDDGVRALSSKSRDGEKSNRRSTERRQRRSRSTERRQRRSRSTERRQRRSRSTESRSRSRSTDRRNSGVEKKRSRSKSRGRRRSMNRDKDQGDRRNIDRQTTDIITSRESDRKSSKEEGKTYPGREMGYRRDQSVESDKGKKRKYIKDRDFTPSDDGRLASRDNDIIEANDRRWLRLNAIENEIERRVFERLKQKDAKLKKEIELITKSRWDISSTEMEHARTSRWDNSSQDIGEASTSRQDNSSESIGEVRTNRSDNSNKDISETRTSRQDNSSESVDEVRTNRWDNSNKDIGEARTSRWDNSNKDIGEVRTNRSDNSNKDIGEARTSRWDNSNKDIGEVRTSRRDNSNESIGEVRTSRWDNSNKDIGEVRTSRWDNNNKDIGEVRTSRWDNRNENIGETRTNRWDSRQSHASDIRSGGVSNASESNGNELGKGPSVKYVVGSVGDLANRGSVKYVVGSVGDLANRGSVKYVVGSVGDLANRGSVKYISEPVSNPANRDAASSNLTPNVSRTPRMPHSKWDTEDAPTDRNEKAVKATEPDKKVTEKGKTKASESLSDLEKFLIGLKEEKKKQWIAEGKLKKKQ